MSEVRLQSDLKAAHQAHPGVEGICEVKLGAAVLWRPTCGLRWVPSPRNNMELQQLWVDDGSGAREWRDIEVVKL